MLRIMWRLSLLCVCSTKVGPPVSYFPAVSYLISPTTPTTSFGGIRISGAFFLLIYKSSTSTHTLEHENYYTNSSASKYRRINELFIFICGFFYRLFQILPSIILTTFFGFFLLSLYTRTIRFHTNALIAILSSVGYTAEKWISSNLHVCSHTIFQIKN